MLKLKGCHFPKGIILQSIRWYVSYPLSYRHVEELMNERGVNLDHATVNRWVIKYSPVLESELRKSKKSVGKSWKMDETYIKVKGEWAYYYRAVDQEGQTVDFFLSPTRDKEAAKSFFEKAIESCGLPQKINMDKSGANYAALTKVNEKLPQTQKITIRQVKYLNNRIEQDHRAIKRITKPMMGFKNFASAAATLAGIELAHMVKKGQSVMNKILSPWKQFYALAG